MKKINFQARGRREESLWHTGNIINTVQLETTALPARSVWTGEITESILHGTERSVFGSTPAFTAILEGHVSGSLGTTVRRTNSGLFFVIILMRMENGGRMKEKGAERDIRTCWQR